jgi:hypothetical protein
MIRLHSRLIALAGALFLATAAAGSAAPAHHFAKISQKAPQPKAAPLTHMQAHKMASLKKQFVATHHIARKKAAKNGKTKGNAKGV